MWCVCIKKATSCLRAWSMTFLIPALGFDLFRFKYMKIVERCDNLIAIKVEKPSGFTQADDVTALGDFYHKHDQIRDQGNFCLP
jgi:hypothetical protein